MTARELLNEVRRTSKSILSLKEELAVIRAKKEGLQSLEISDKVKTSALFTNSLDELICQEEQILQECKAIHCMWWQCRQLINQIGNKDYSDTLRYYYLLNYKTWGSVARKIHVSERQIYTIHGKALEEFRKISGLK